MRCCEPLSPLADCSQTLSECLNFKQPLELCLKGAEQKAASAAVGWAGTLQGAHAVRPQHWLQAVSQEGDAEDSAAQQLHDEQAGAASCPVMGLVWSAVPLRCCMVGTCDSRWHLSSFGLLKIDHCEHPPC